MHCYNICGAFTALSLCNPLYIFLLASPKLPNSLQHCPTPFTLFVSYHSVRARSAPALPWAHPLGQMCIMYSDTALGSDNQPPATTTAFRPSRREPYPTHGLLHQHRLSPSVGPSGGVSGVVDPLGHRQSPSHRLGPRPPSGPTTPEPPPLGQRQQPRASAPPAL